MLMVRLVVKKWFMTQVQASLRSCAWITSKTRPMLKDTLIQKLWGRLQLICRNLLGNQSLITVLHRTCINGRGSLETECPHKKVQCQDAQA